MNEPGMSAAQMLNVGGIDSDDEPTDMATPEQLMGKRPKKMGVRKAGKSNVSGNGQLKNKKVNLKSKLKLESILESQCIFHYKKKIIKKKLHNEIIDS